MPLQPQICFSSLVIHTLPSPSPSLLQRIILLPFSLFLPQELHHPTSTSTSTLHLSTHTNLPTSPTPTHPFLLRRNPSLHHKPLQLLNNLSLSQKSFLLFFNPYLQISNPLFLNPLFRLQISPDLRIVVCCCCLMQELDVEWFDFGFGVCGWPR